MKDKLIEDIKSNKIWFCFMPFYQIYSSSSGSFAPCCHATDSNMNVGETTTLKWYTSDELNNLRNEMLTPNSSHTYINKFCHKCKDVEKNGGESFRHYFLKQKLNDNLILHNVLKYKHKKEMTLNGRFLELKLRLFSYKCNISCVMCQAKNSSKRHRILNNMNDEWKDEFQYDKINSFDINDSLDDFLKYDYDIIIPHTKHIILTGGEPLVNKSHFKLLNKLIETGDSKHIHLTYQTNLTTLKEFDFEYYISNFEHVHFSASVEAIGKYNDYIRRGSHWNKIEEHIDLLQSYKNVTIDVKCLLMSLNIFFLNETKKYFEDRNIRFVYFMIYNPDFFSIKHLPQNIKDLLKIKFKDDIMIVNELNLERKEFQYQKLLAYLSDLDVTDSSNYNLEELYSGLLI